MVAKIRSTFQRVAQDGRVGKADVKALAEQALDGQGITKNEAAQLRKLREEHADKFTAAGLKAMDSFLGAMGRSWSRTKEVHLPNVDDEKLQELLDDPRVGFYNRGGGSESGGARRATPRAPAHTGGTRRTRGGE